MCTQTRRAWAAVPLVAVLLPGGAAEAEGSVCRYFIDKPNKLVAEDQVPLTAETTRSVRVAVLEPLRDGILVVARQPGHEKGGHGWPAWRIGGKSGEVSPVSLPLEAGESVLCAASAGSSVLLGTTHGLARVQEGGAARLEEFADLGVKMHVGAGPPYRLPRADLVRMAVGADLNVWCELSDSAGSAVFSLDERLWPSESAGQTLGGRYPRIRRWRAASEVMAGDPRDGGAWTYGFGAHGEAILSRLRPPSWRDRARSSISAERVLPKAKLPILTGAALVADARGRVWLAGDSLAGATVVLYDGERIIDVSPPHDLMRCRRVSDLSVDAAGVLYAATDGVGVLAFDGERWATHPISAHLAAIENTEMRPVEHLAVDATGRLWAANGWNVVGWRGEP